jgi:hypothetical protein
MTETARMLKLVTEQGRSISTDKLSLLCITADSIAAANPEIAKRVTSFEMEWREISGTVVPFVRMTFNG